MRYAAGLIMFMGLASASALAHNPLDSAGWCTVDAVPTVVAEFTWTGEALVRADSGTCRSSSRASAVPGDEAECEAIPPHHGLFDDDWDNVSKRAEVHCDDYALEYAYPAHPDWGSVVVIGIGPASYTDEEDHHELYKLEHGLSAACVRCQPVIRPRPRLPVRRIGQ